MPAARARKLIQEAGGLDKLPLEAVGLIWPLFQNNAPYDAELQAIRRDLLGAAGRERDAALTRKLELLSRAAGMFHDLLQTRRSLRVEWYIVILIAVEIVILMYDRWVR